jgi:hypothetical protein
MPPLAWTVKPVYVGMPPTDRRFAVMVDSHQREIRCGGPCRDNYFRIVIHDEQGQIVKLQRAAWESFAAAESYLGFQIVLTGSWRSCAYQRELYAKDHARYAPPDKTAHCRGLAIDVSTALPPHHQTAIRSALTARGWHQARPDEPWHYSFGIQV